MTIRKSGDRNRVLALGLIDDIRADLALGHIDYATASLTQLATQVRGAICTHCPYFQPQDEPLTAQHPRTANSQS